VTQSIPYFPGPHRDFIGLERLLRSAGKMRIGRIGNAVVRLMKSRDLIDLTVEAGRRDPAFVLCENPNCADCVAQRAVLRRERLRREEFTTAASAALAGRYVPEIVDNCRAAGIDAVELDYLQGRPVHKLRGVKLADAVRSLRDEGLGVTSLRLGVISSKLAGTFAEAADLHIGRVVLPLSAEAPAHAAAAGEKGLTASFCNVGLASEKVLEFMSAARAADERAGLTFNVANFARVAENPFTSFRARLARFIDQLDVEDCTFDGTPTPLAMGNAETKEVISAIRCRSFAGAMVLGAGNRGVMDLLGTARRFVELLEAM
jgi:sugar phosphate isomerase/epimerase